MISCRVRSLVRSFAVPPPYHWSTVAHCRLLSLPQNSAFHPRRNFSTQTLPPSRLQLFNSLTDQLQTLDSTVVDGEQRKGVACYTCGPTVYAPMHLGHARTYVWLDILRRIWEHQHQRQSSATPAPLFVMNITDVDDKILQQATSNQQDPLLLARRFEAEFFRDLDALHCLRPHVVTRVTEHVNSHIVPFVQRLIEQGMAYVIPDDGVYFDVKSFEHQKGTFTRYGKLAPPAQSTAFWDSAASSTDTANAHKKKDPRDFVLWKMHKPGEAMVWQAPWGKGRPGWHIECSAMIEAVQSQFQETHRFVLHTGGVDLKFPHHTNEIAQSEAYHHHTEASTDREWIPHWVHFGHLHIDGRKMSKSLKNFVSVQELLVQPETHAQAGGLASVADDFRLWCLLTGSYRSPTTYSTEQLDNARAMRGRIVRFLVTAEEWMTQVEDSLTRCDTTRLWTSDDANLFKSTQLLASSHFQKLLDDLDGAAWIKDVSTFVDNGMSYMSRQKPAEGTVDAMKAAVQTMRQMLTIVGFSRTTVEAGKVFDNSLSSRVAGGESALIDALVDFRHEVRKISLDISQSQTTANDESAQEILRICDDFRDRTLPSLGIELMDRKVSEQEAADSVWQYCVPRTEERTEITPSTSKKTLRLEELRQISVEDYFRSPLFEGEFSAFDKEGFPTHNADGSEISKKLRKKLLKKRSIHEKRLRDV